MYKYISVPIYLPNYLHNTFDDEIEYCEVIVLDLI